MLPKIGDDAQITRNLTRPPENQLCGQLFLDRTSDKRQIRRAVRSALGRRGVSNGRRSDNARKRYSSGFASVSSRGSETPNGKDVTVTTTGGANPILPSATLHRVKLLMVFAMEHFS